MTVSPVQEQDRQPYVARPRRPEQQEATGPQLQRAIVTAAGVEFRRWHPPGATRLTETAPAGDALRRGDPGDAREDPGGRREREPVCRAEDAADPPGRAAGPLGRPEPVLRGDQLQRPTPRRRSGRPGRASWTLSRRAGRP